MSRPAEWENAGTYRHLHGFDVFVVDVPTAAQTAAPLMVLHGFPTSSFDFAGIVDTLARGRRVILLDFVGYGLSAKPDVAYTMGLQADVVVALADELGLTRLSLLTHDMGDTVGGELLARQLEGSWPVAIERRVITNGSIYIEMAHLSVGQEFLLSLPDAMLPAETAPDLAALSASLAATLSPASELRAESLLDHARLVCHSGGNRLLPRTIRYIEERRRNQDRFTGAIEKHPSPLSIVWGTDDPIAVAPMADRLHAARPDADLCLLHDVGHYPMLEAPDAFASAVIAALDA